MVDEYTNRSSTVTRRTHWRYDVDIMLPDGLRHLWLSSDPSKEPMSIEECLAFGPYYGPELDIIDISWATAEGLP